MARLFPHRTRNGRPSIFAIDPDNYRAKHVGHTSDGRQFFLTDPFDGALEYLALYIFDCDGALLEARIEKLEGKVDGRSWDLLCEARLEILGTLERRRIFIAPFEVEHGGKRFGLIAREPESSDEPWWVEAQPGDYMAFTAPWLSGKYDT